MGKKLWTTLLSPTSAKPAPRRPARRRARLAVDELEPRVVPATYYVTKAGSDANPSGTQAAPWLTLARAFDATKATRMQAGDTLYIGAGTYAENLDYVGSANQIPNGNSAADPTEIRNISGQQVVLRPDAADGIHGIWLGYRGNQSHISVIGSAANMIVLDGTNMTGTPSGVQLGGNNGNTVNNIILQNIEIKNFSGYAGANILTGSGFNRFTGLNVHDNGTEEAHHHGIYIVGTDNTVENCDVWNNASHGIHVYGGHSYDLPGSASRNVIRNNKVHDNSRVSTSSSPGIGIYTGDDNRVYNNLVWDNPTGIIVGLGATDTKIYSNTVYNNNRNSVTHYGIFLKSAYGGNTNTTVRNNIAYLNGDNGANNFLDQGVGTVKTNNSTAGTNPNFASTVETNANFLKLSATTPTSIVNAGFALGSPYNVDFDGTSRPQGSAYDIGADEYVSTTPPAAPTALNATAASTSQINLTWTDNSTNETGFEVDRATNSTFTAGLTTVTVAAHAGTGTTTYSSTGLAAGTTYYYRVRATIGGTNDSANSNSASATTTANPPTLLPQGQLSVHATTTAGIATAANVLDGNTGTRATITGFPQELVIALGGTYSVARLQQTSYSTWSALANYEIYVSTSTSSWGAAVKTGTFVQGLNDVTFTPKTGAYLKLRYLSSVGGANYCYTAEVNVGVTNPMTAAGGEVTGRDVAALDRATLDRVAAQARRLWVRAGADVSALAGVRIVVADLPGDLLAVTSGSVVTVDRDAAGYGWYTGEANPRGVGLPRGQAGVGMDLLTVLSHEYGHVLGAGHSDRGVMRDALGEGERYLPRRRDLGDAGPRRWHARPPLGLRVHPLAPPVSAGEGIPDLALGVYVG